MPRCTHAWIRVVRLDSPAIATWRLESPNTLPRTALGYAVQWGRCVAVFSTALL